MASPLEVYSKFVLAYQILLIRVLGKSSVVTAISNSEITMYTRSYSSLNIIMVIAMIIAQRIYKNKFSWNLNSGSTRYNNQITMTTHTQTNIHILLILQYMGIT